ncbi:MAG: hypothetical protein HY788_01275 [Deltaproteobacteria bacterium]|nr:hypothetical protein [Deltaproteobacteria bacterium]
MRRTFPTVALIIALFQFAGIHGFSPPPGRCSAEAGVLHEGWNNFRGATYGSASSTDGGCRITAAESTMEFLRLNVELPGVEVRRATFEDGNRYTLVTAPGSGRYKVGGPDVPVFGTWILIPNGTRADLSVSPGRAVHFEDVDLPPIQPPSADKENAPPNPFVKDESIYSADAAYPAVFAYLEPTKIMRGQACTILWIYPYQHNPVQRSLCVYPDLEVAVRFQGTASPIPQEFRSESFDNLMRGFASNADAVLGISPVPAKRVGESYPKEPAAADGDQLIGCDFVIITHTLFQAAANKLAAWKEQIGFRTCVEVYASPSVMTIRNLIAWYYTNNDIKPYYVLLLGDAEYIPCDYRTAHPWDSTPSLPSNLKQGKIGTDLYYAAIDGTDYIPDIAIGRLSVGSAADAMDFVDRIIEYEKDPPVLTTFYDDVAVCAYFEDGKGVPGFDPDGIEDSRYTMTSEDLAIFLSDAAYGINKTVTRIYYAKPEVTPDKWNNNQYLALPNFGGGPAGNPGETIPSYLKKPGFAWDGGPTQITGAFESGSFLITHRDHGSRQYWAQPYFHSAHLGTLQIRWGEYPVVWSVNCETGWFDNETDYPTLGDTDLTGYHEESFAEFLSSYCSLGGPVGVIAATRVTDAIYNDRLMWGWTDGIWPNFIPTEGWPLWIFRMGDVLLAGKLYMATKVADDAAGWRKAHFEMYHWLGDPTMEIRNAYPGFLEAEHPVKWPWRNRPHDFKVHVQWINGFPVWLARVTVSRSGAPADQRVGWTDLNGDVVFTDLVTSQPGDYTVTAVFPNAAPYLGTFESSEFKPGFLPALLGALLGK